MGLIFIAVVGIYLFFTVMIVIAAYTPEKKWISVIVGIVLIAAPLHDIPVKAYLLHRFAKEVELSRIDKVVEYPESVYWEDRVFNGFSSMGRKFMVKYFLDGKYLKRLALLGNDNLIYVYDYGVTEPIVYHSDKGPPKTNYTVSFNKIKMPKLTSFYIWGDEITITENAYGKVIAFSKRFLPKPGIAVSFLTTALFDDGMHIGEFNAYAFDEKVLFTHAGKIPVNKSLWSSNIRTDK